MSTISQIKLVLRAVVVAALLIGCQKNAEDDSKLSDSSKAESNSSNNTSEIVRHADGYEEIPIWSQGVRLSGRIYLPTELEPGKKLPGLLLVNGWGGTVENTSARYAKIFSEQGYVVLTHDFKGWGKSNGPLYLEKQLPAGTENEEVTVTVKHIRNLVDPISFLADTEAALDVLASDPRVQSRNIGVWGTSMGGGVSLITVANNSNVKAYVNQIGAVNHKANFFMIAERTISDAEAGVARGLIPAYPDSTAKLPHLNGNPNYISIKRMEPFDYVDQVNVPTLIIDAHDEELFDRLKNGKAFYEAIKDRVESEYMTLPGQHYDIYRQESPKAIDAAIKWFNQHLKGA